MPICTTTQRKLMFIPIVNIAIPFIWMRNCRLNGEAPSGTLLGSVLAFACLLPFGIIQLFCNQYFEDFSVIFSWLTIYFAPMLIGYVLIRYQEFMERKSCAEESKSGIAFVFDKKAILVCFAVLLMLIVGISVASFVVEDYKDKNIPDQNGPDDFSLAVLTRDDLTSEWTKSVIIGRRSVTRGGRTDAPNRYTDCDRDFLKISTRSMSGVRTIHATKVACKQLTLSIESSLTAGNAAIVVLVDGEYYCDIEINETDSITLEDVSDKLVEVRLAGESAETEVSITRMFK